MPYFDTLAYLQEWPDLAAALERVDYEYMQDATLVTVVICRGLAILMEHGVESDIYQGVLAQPSYEMAVSQFLRQSGQDDALATDPRFDLSSIAWIKDQAIFFVPGKLDIYLEGWTTEVAQSLLKQYAEIRLNGNRLRRNDLDEGFRQIGVFDPIEDVCAEDHQAIHAHLPAFWCALHWLGIRANCVSAIWEVVSKNPIGVPSFPGLDLWMQRKAALLAYDNLGMTPFLICLTSVRPELFQFIALMRAVSGQDRERLCQALDRLDVPDCQGEYFSLRKWLVDRDIQLD